MDSVHADQAGEAETAASVKPTSGEIPKCNADRAIANGPDQKLFNVTVVPVNASASRELPDTNVTGVTVERPVHCPIVSHVESALITGIRLLANSKVCSVLNFKI